MSDFGLHAGLYGEIREFAELVDSVIADITVETREPSQWRKLAERLDDIGAADSRGLVMRYLGPTAARQNWSELAQALRADPTPEGTIERLESLARALDTRRSAALARIHGVDAR
jgi:hypothetical protein